MKKVAIRYWLSIAAFLLLQISVTTIVYGQQLLHGTVPANIARLGLKPICRLDSTKQLNLAICLPIRNETTLNDLLWQIYDPTSPNYHHYLTVEQFTSEFGPSSQDYQSVIAFAKANGLTVTGTPSNNMLLDVSGSVANIEKAFHLTMRVYHHPTEARTFYAPDNDPSVDLAVPILRISGLDNYSLPRPHSKATRIINGENATANAGSGPGNPGTYWGTDFRAAYVPSVSLNGSGQKLGLLQFDGYNASDITYYENYKTPHLPNVTLTNVLLDGFNGNPIGNEDWDREVCLDIEMAISMAPGLSGVVVYEAGPNGSYDDIITRMATDNSCKQLSSSWGLSGDVVDSYADQIFKEMAMQGQSFFNASGDIDAITNSTWISGGDTVYSYFDFPSEDTNITQVGGTTLTTTGPGGSWSSESVWNTNTYYASPTNAFLGSTGGVSTLYSIPSWQKGINMSNNQGSTTMQNVPDVALTADNVYVRCSLPDGNDWTVVGTSCAAPLWAGFIALANQQAANFGYNTAGLINHIVYSIGKITNYNSYFHDITSGNNAWPGSSGKFSAVAGYDLCTGWGTPNGQALINAFSSVTVSISGPTYLNMNQAGTYTCTVSDGVPSYNYQWWKEENGVPGLGPISSTTASPERPAPGNWYQVGTNSPTLSSSDVTNFSVKCVVTDAIFKSNTNDTRDSTTSNILSVAVGGSGNIAAGNPGDDAALVTLIPENNSLSQNYPNPFNPSTEIRFGLTKPAHVRLVVYDILGREVASLADEQMDAGYHSVSWNASGVSSGVYIYRLTAGSFVQTRRMLVVK